jgi:hypothetical protein
MIDSNFSNTNYNCQMKFYFVIGQWPVLFGHMEQESVLACLREKFWVLKGRTAARRVIRSCVDCQRRKKPTCEHAVYGRLATG